MANNILMVIHIYLTKVYLCSVGEPPNTEEALKWLYKASFGGNVRAQYQLALCLHRGRGIRSNMKEAVGALSYSYPYSLTFNYMNFFLGGVSCWEIRLDLCLRIGL